LTAWRAAHPYCPRAGRVRNMSLIRGPWQLVSLAAFRALNCLRLEGVYPKRCCRAKHTASWSQEVYSGEGEDLVQLPPAGRKGLVQAMNLNPLVWEVDPEIVRLGPFRLRWYGLFFALGFILGHEVLAQLYRREGRPLENLPHLLLYLLLGTIIGA